MKTIHKCIAVKLEKIQKVLGQKNTLHNDKRVKLPGRYKANIDKLKRKIDSNKMIDFNILISIMARNPNRRSKKEIRKHLNASEKKKPTA